VQAGALRDTLREAGNHPAFQHVPGPRPPEQPNGWCASGGSVNRREVAIRA